MKDDKPESLSPLTLLAGLIMVWVIIKGWIIGYYDDELFPQIVLPALAAIALFGIDKFRKDRAA